MAGFFEDEEDEDREEDEDEREDREAREEWINDEIGDPDREYDDSDSGDADLW